MTVACLMPTYNRYPKSKRLVEEAVESFLRQDYEDRLLLICNDTPGQNLVFDHPKVMIWNWLWRFDFMSNKLCFLIDEGLKLGATMFCRWDDDDISLPHRLSYSVNKLSQQLIPLEWRSSNYYYCPPKKAIEVNGAANTHVMSIWTKSAMDRIGGYPPDRNGDEDITFNNLLRQHEIGTSERIPKADIFYLYRWGVSPVHLSGHGPQRLNQHYKKIGERPIEKGAFEISPKWYEDYVLRGREGQADRTESNPPQPPKR